LTFLEPAARPSDPTSRERRRQATEPNEFTRSELVDEIVRGWKDMLRNAERSTMGPRTRGADESMAR
jgi:hypothetical protein